jgi:hypothetical protein
MEITVRMIGLLYGHSTAIDKRNAIAKPTEFKSCKESGRSCTDYQNITSSSLVIHPKSVP